MPALDQRLPPTVFIVDDDESVRRGLARLIKSAGMAVVSFASAQEFVQSYPRDVPGCLLLDIQMPGMSGLELQEQMARYQIDLPVIFLTGHAEVPASVRAMKRGATDFLQKPVDGQVLIETISQAMATNRLAREKGRVVKDIQRRVERLTEREREVMEGVIAGLLNKQIADRLQIAEKTVKVHRRRVMEKLVVKSVAELVRLVTKVGR
ncbi:MAG: response regulator [Nitrococcus sp.]|nr:response regulator [Nitrococcus sp.]